MYIRIYVCIYIYIYIYVYMYTYIHMYMYICIYIYMYTHIYMFICIFMYFDFVFSLSFARALRFAFLINLGCIVFCITHFLAHCCAHALIELQFLHKKKNYTWNVLTNSNVRSSMGNIFVVNVADSFSRIHTYIQTRVGPFSWSVVKWHIDSMTT